MKRLLTLTALLLVVMLCAPAAEIGAQEREGGDVEPVLVFPHGHDEESRVWAWWGPDESRILTSDGWTGIARLWSVDDDWTAKWLSELDICAEAMFCSIVSVRWSSDQTRFITSIGSQAGYWTMFWDIDGQPFATLSGWVYGWNAGETRILTVWNWDCYDAMRSLSLSNTEDPEPRLNRMDIWSSEGELLRTIETKRDILAWWSLDGKRILSVHNALCPELCGDDCEYGDACIDTCESIIQVWSVDGELLKTFTHDPRIWDVYWNADETFFISQTLPPYDCERDCLHRLYLWNADGQLLKTFEFDKRPSVLWNSDGTRFMVWTWYDGSVRVYSTEPVETVFSLDLENAQDEGGLESAEWNADETQILTWMQDAPLRIWPAEGEIKRGDELLTFDYRPLIANATIPLGEHGYWNRDKTRVLIASPDRDQGYRVAVLSIATGEVTNLPRGWRSLWGVHWYEDEIHMLASDEENIYVWVVPLN